MADAAGKQGVDGRSVMTSDNQSSCRQSMITSKFAKSQVDCGG